MSKRLQRRARIASKAKIHENNFVAKKPDSELGAALFSAQRRRARCCAHQFAMFCVVKEVRIYQRLFSFLITEMFSASCMKALRPCDAIESLVLLRLSHRARCVNTSLSGTLFFLMRWCNPNAVHFDSRVHDSDTAISL